MQNWKSYNDVVHTYTCGCISRQSA